MAEHNEKGIHAEELARKYLIEKGHGLLHNNWKCGHREIDIITEFENYLVITEVKGRLAKNYENPTDLLPYWKMKHLVIAAEVYINRFNIEKEVRFDLIVVIFEADSFRIEHFESVFIPGVNW
jgi:putative endonuclease